MPGNVSARRNQFRGPRTVELPNGSVDRTNISPVKARTIPPSEGKKVIGIDAQVIHRTLTGL